MKKLMITHTDLDGIGAGIIGNILNFEVVYKDYHEINEYISGLIRSVKSNNYEEIIITDVSPNEETTKLMNKYRNFKLVDHHATSLKYAQKYNWAKVETHINEKMTCATELIFLIFQKYLNDIEIDCSILSEFVEIVRKYDTWDWNRLGVKEPKMWNDLLYIYGRETFTSEIVSRINSNSLKFTGLELTILKNSEDQMNKYIKYRSSQIKKMVWGCQNIAVVFAEQYGSNLGNTIAKENPDIDYVVVINMGGGMSFYKVKDGFNLGTDIATKFGGGGHPDAAGAPLPDGLQEMIIEKLFISSTKE